MIGQYRGKRLFAGRLFAGRLFGPEPTARGRGGGRGRWVDPDQPRRRGRRDEEVLLFLLR